MEETLTGTTPTDQRGPRSNSNERVLYTSQILGIGAHQMLFGVIP